MAVCLLLDGKPLSPADGDARGQPRARHAAAERCFGVYTQAFNRRHKRVGHVLQGRYKAILVDEDAYLLELCRYVVLDPVRAGLVADPAEWL